MYILFLRNYLYSFHFIIYIKLMISLKVQHPHHLPCHPTRQYLQEQGSIFETDREHISDNSESDYEIMTNQTPFDDYRPIDNQTLSSMSPVGSRMKVPIKSKQGAKIQAQIYEADMIEKHFQDSVSVIPNNIRGLIMQKQKAIEDKIYLGLSENKNQLLERIYKEIDSETYFKDQIKQNLDEMMNGIHGRIEDDIGPTDKYIIHNIIRANKGDILKRKKQRKSEKLKQQTYSVGASRAGKELKQKITILKESFDDQSFISESNPPSKQDYSLNSERTKKAEEFVKKLTKQQEQSSKRKKEKEERKKSLEVRSLQEKRQFEKQLKNERKNYLRRKMATKKEMKEKELEVRERMNKEYAQFLAKYKKQTPLFKKKQKEYMMQSIDEQIRKKQSIINDKMQERKGYRLDDIKQHQKKYLQLRTEKQNEKKNERKFMIEERPQNLYFKSKIYDVVVEEEEQEKERQVKEDPKLIRSQLIKKRDLYSKSVRENFLPKGSEAKHQELIQLMEKIKWAEKLKSGKKDDLQYKEEGIKNLKRVHELIAQLRKEGKLAEKSQTIEYSTKPNYKDYLQELRQITKDRRYSIDFYEKMAEDDIKGTKKKAQDYESKAKRRQLYLKGGSLNIEKTIEEKKKIDEEYLSAVKAKIAILNKVG